LSTDDGSTDDRRASTQAARMMGVGLQFAGSIVLFLLLGQWLDARLGTEPWLLITGVMVGSTAGFYSLYRQLMSETRPPDRKGPGDGRDGTGRGA
jgi:ATP synthase protein I